MVDFTIVAVFLLHSSRRFNNETLPTSGIFLVEFGYLNLTNIFYTMPKQVQNSLPFYTFILKVAKTPVTSQLRPMIKTFEFKPAT